VGYDPAIHHRRSIRLANYDYSSPGLYFVTLCTQEKAALFGEIASAQMVLSDAGRMVESWWKRLPGKFAGLLLEEFVVMPNHMHALLGLTHLPDAGRPGRPMAPLRRVQPPPVSRVVQWFKTMTTNAYFRGVRQAGWSAVRGRLWQRDYYEHIVRTARAAQRVALYILENPQRWAFDAENPEREHPAPDPIDDIIAADP
jgi:REP-associated tyrosine transposase